MDSRHVLLEGSLNLRDLGGYPSGDGSLIRNGCLYRSDELHALTDADLEVVNGLGIRVVFDLRSIHERTARPNRLPLDVELLERASSSPHEGQTTEEQISLLQARRPVLATALRHVHEQWGGFEGFARDHLAVEADLPERLRTALLEPIT